MEVKPPEATSAPKCHVIRLQRVYFYSESAILKFGRISNFNFVRNRVAGSLTKISAFDSGELSSLRNFHSSKSRHNKHAFVLAGDRSQRFVHLVNGS
ncbi:hypothetical protein TSAR_012258 [Trichomalopsis sarcophagae]|uniref:Uncharacterized protein n=1 Tax=Trichomalopsis sarcophagae TaxID=543379 RepID=A0A232FA66_9HYME|nr:hypothetical protein TSAR_012258 [Trichomalopsis sarcophagae]